MPEEITPSLFPRRWFPFLWPQKHVEEIVDVKVRQCGHYDPAAIPNCATSYFDKAANKTVGVTFLDGKIWKTEVKYPDQFEMVILGDDNRVYRNSEPLPGGVVALAYSVERIEGG